MGFAWVDAGIAPAILGLTPNLRQGLILNMDVKLRASI
jgi:hypothetical protein